MAIKYKQCPKCGSSNSLKIIYGYPSFELFQEAEAGKIKLGGCCKMEGGPEYLCKDCGHEWNKEHALDYAYSKIKAIKASVGGFFGGYYNVDIDLDNLKITWSFWGEGEEKTIHKRIRHTTVEKFRKELKRSNILNWKAKYINPGICDGTQWSLDIIIDNRTFKKYGSNKFPKEWDLFCETIKKMTGTAFK